MTIAIKEPQPIGSYENQESIAGKGIRFDSSEWAAVRERYARLAKEITIHNPLYWMLGMPRNVYDRSECETCMLFYTDDQFREYIEIRKDVLQTESAQEVLSWVGSHHRMLFMYICMDYFLSREGYEECLVAAWTSSKIDNSVLDLDQKLELFDEADLDKLKAAGDPLPPGDNLTIYRGCSGGGKRLNKAREAMSWTLSLDVAEWFAVRFRGKPVVYKTTISRADVLFYSNQMKEQEVVAILPIDAQIEVIKHSGRTLEQIYEIKRQRANPDQLSSGTPDLQPSQY